MTDGTSDAFKVVQTMLELSGEKINCHTLKLFLVGSSQKCIKDNGLDKFATFGCLQKKFVPNILLDKFLHSLIMMCCQRLLKQKIIHTWFLQSLAPKHILFFH